MHFIPGFGQQRRGTEWLTGLARGQTGRSEGGQRGTRVCLEGWLSKPGGILRVSTPLLGYSLSQRRRRALLG